MTDPRDLSPGVLARVFAAYLALMGVIYGLVYSIGGVFYDLAHGGLNAGTAIAFLALVVVPILAALIGIIVGYIFARPVAWVLMHL